VVTRDNWREVLDCARIVSGIGVDNLRISAFFQPQNAVYFRDFHVEAADLCRETEKLSDENFQVINNFGSRVADLELESPDYKRCAYQNFTAYIGGDQNVYRCCVLSFTERGTVGSLKDQTLSQLWKSEARHQDYENFDARQCPRCQFNDKNHDINRMIDELPVMHGNFV
jgi:MoaA/NifB/PqqE/SkfB family radical SAM enzyme